MKILTLFCLFPLAFFCESVNAQLYIVTEHNVSYYNNNAIAYKDSVFVTNPAGITTKYEIPTTGSDIPGHDSQLNKILNDIINLGYKNMYPVYVAVLGADRIFYLAKP